MSKTKIHYPQWKNRSASSNPRRDISYRELVEAITLTAEVCGQALSRAAAELLADDLADFSEDDVMTSLARCRLELQGPLRVKEILLRLEDGRPGVDEAWALLPRDERTSVVWTEEMAHAWGAVLPMLESGDVGGAQTVFRELYVKCVLEARLRREPARWTPSLGSDVAAREQVLREAVEMGRMTAAHAEQLLQGSSKDAEEVALLEQADIKNLH
ncbi:hypothetical protein [Noviherbaspirillum malthae]|jgi:hypothetical protein|uniref:hypothetical protein n=1 Tax=Noviherbaspirillum malthae TaxID=1260987 RepID=UPI001890749A|nr:hypothetical protein [Noviherbaspirillum malthae]